MATGEAIVRNALNQLKSTVTRDDVRMFSDTSLDDLWREVRKIEVEQGARSDLQFMRRAEHFLRTMEGYAGVIEVLCQGYSPMAFVWGPIKLMLLLARNYSNVMEKILQAFSDIADVLPRLDRLKATFPEDTNFSQVVGLIYSDIMEFHRRAYKMFRRKAWHFWFAVDWGLFERRFKSILQRLSQHCDLLDKEAAAVHFSEMKRFRDKHQLEEDAFEQQRQVQMACDVFTWLSTKDAAPQEDAAQQEDKLHRMSENRQPETCEWLLKDPQMRTWIEDDCGDAVLWMTGIPGAGKSLLCSLVIQNLQSQQRFSTLYYFCSHKTASPNTCAIMLRTLTIQLLQQNLDMASLVYQAYLQKGSNLSSQTMKTMLIKLLPPSKVARIVIDGMDEIDHATQQEVLRNLVELQKSTDHSCKLLVSSRKEPQIRKSLAANSHLELGEKTVEGLNLYIRERIKDLQTELDYLEKEPGLLSLVEQRLRSKAKGMFLWVRLVIDMLRYNTCVLDFRSEIDQLPEGLDDAYGLIKSRIISLRPIQLRQRAFNILYWVCVSRRSILLHEVADGIALHPNQTALNRSTRSNNPIKDIVELCAPLLERLDNGVLDLVHFSAKEYFLHEQSGPFIDVAKAHLSISLSCIINMTSCLDLVPGKVDRMSEEEVESRVVQGCYGLQSYGYEAWAEHILAYLEKVEDQDGVSRELISALEAFSQVCKHRHTGTSFSSALHTPPPFSGLNRLCNHPALHSLTSDWLQFKSEFDKTRPTFDTLDSQEQWRLRKDETVLSLIDSRLGKLRERLLMMQSNQLPSHIDENDFKHFIGRYRFLCRFQGCNYQFDTVQERDSHEESHVLSFPCLQCDFSRRGFRSRKDLERHTQKYHMSAEDFEIPSDLHSMQGVSRGSSNAKSRSFRTPSSRSGKWTERGRKAIQQGFQSVLVRLESEIAATGGDTRELSSGDMPSAEAAGPSLSQYPKGTMTMPCLDFIRQSIREQNYVSLADFKDDLRVLAREPKMASGFAEEGRIESICDEELEKAMSGFPAFANFDRTVSTKGRIVASLINGTGQLQESAEDFIEHKNTTENESPAFFGARVPYWSQPEEKQFPELLQRYGRNFARIADHFKTKTPEEVNQHFLDLLSMGKAELSNSADLADTRLQQEFYNTGTEMGLGHVELERRAPAGLAYDSFLQTSEAFNEAQNTTYGGNPDLSLTLMQGITKNAGLNLESSERADGPIRKKRRPQPRVLCPYCSLYEDGLSDEWALKRHIERFHTATRRVWICEDISFDKKFLTKCKSCSASKRYSSKNKAGEHLRKKHFNATTSAETLQRWMRETEEPNPKNMQTPSDGSTLTTRPTLKSQITGRETFSLPPIQDHIDSRNKLPNTIFEAKSQKNTNSASSSGSSSGVEVNLTENAETDVIGISLSLPEADSFRDNTFLEDVSFDNFLPGDAIPTRFLDNDGPPHRTNRALIKPDQVPRLPTLDPFRKAACLDQVEALYYRLDNAPKNGLAYQEALKSLNSLSRSLMRNLRDWRQHSTLAPEIPFSI